MTWTFSRARAVVRLRAGGRCERCGVALRTDYWSCHHRRPRGMGGTKRADAHSPANLVALCGTATTGCHGWVESNRTLATAQGWLVPSHGDPAKVPVPVDSLPLPVFLTDEGGYRVAA